jgi:hypothetical protein
LDSLKLTPRTTTLGCGIYEAGDPQKCYAKLFVTEGGRVLPVSHHAITEDDLMTVYKWGREEEQEAWQTSMTDNPVEMDDNPF